MFQWVQFVSAVEGFRVSFGQGFRGFPCRNSPMRLATKRQSLEVRALQSGSFICGTDPHSFLLNFDGPMPAAGERVTLNA